MFIWKYSETVEVDTDANQVWAMWSDPVTWPVWDTELEWVSLDGDFAEGVKGSMKPVKGPRITFELVEVRPNMGFIDRARLPLTKLDFGHYYIPASNGEERAHITHSVEFHGFLAPLFGMLIGRNIKRHLRAAMLELAKRARTVDKTTGG